MCGVCSFLLSLLTATWYSLSLTCWHCDRNRSLNNTLGYIISLKALYVLCVYILRFHFKAILRNLWLRRKTDNYQSIQGPVWLCMTNDIFIVDPSSSLCTYRVWIAWRLFSLVQLRKFYRRRICAVSEPLPKALLSGSRSLPLVWDWCPNRTEATHRLHHPMMDQC